MARYKNYSYDQQVLLPINLKNQILPETFEYTLNHVINGLDLSIFDKKYINDETGSPAYDPAILLKAILFAYSRGMNSSRKIAKLCRENIICIALTADTKPHFTTIADFISSLDTECIELFTKILSICYAENLIGKNMFAIDGCKISSNCSKEWSGTKEELLRKSKKIKKSIKYLVSKHKKTDLDLVDDKDIEKEQKSIKKLKANAKKISAWLDTHDDRMGTQNKPVKSNITDNESAKMATSHGVIQGYNGIAAVDDKHQVIVCAETFGDCNESGHLPEILECIEENCINSGISNNVLHETQITADTGFHSERNMKLVFDDHIDAYIPDNQFRKRDIRFENVAIHRKKTANWQRQKGKKYFRKEDFHFDSVSGKLVCPAGKPMWLKCKNFQTGKPGYKGKSYMGHIKNCRNCKLRSKCIRKETTPARQIAIFESSKDPDKRTFTQRMRDKFDTPFSRSVYSKRMGTVEPVFGHLRGTKKLDRFTLRGKKKVNNQWLLYCIVHNIGKISRYGK